MTKFINKMEFENEVIKSDLPVVVNFTASWCGPCKLLSPVLEQISDELAEKAKIVKIDVDQNKDTAMEFNVKSVPTMLVFKNGEIVDKVVGAVPKAQLKEKITTWM